VDAVRKVEMYTITEMYGVNKRFEIVKDKLKVTMLIKGVQTLTEEIKTQDA
jgi:isopentenyl diphosphate isomerase/L-lactate dehydrogenase-like FMN-dependent dehydrogenase